MSGAPQAFYPAAAYVLGIDWHTASYLLYYPGLNRHSINYLLFSVVELYPNKDTVVRLYATANTDDFMLIHRVISNYAVNFPVV